MGDGNHIDETGCTGAVLRECFHTVAVCLSVQRDGWIRAAAVRALLQLLPNATDATSGSRQVFVFVLDPWRTGGTTACADSQCGAGPERDRRLFGAMWQIYSVLASARPLAAQSDDVTVLLPQFSIPDPSCFEVDAVFSDSRESTDIAGAWTECRAKFVQWGRDTLFFDLCRLDSSASGAGPPLLSAPMSPPASMPAVILALQADRYDRTVLGGAFDRLHVGHRMLLAVAAYSTRRNLLVGVTGGDGKLHAALVQPFAVRMRAVRRFIRSMRPTLLCDVQRANRCPYLERCPALPWHADAVVVSEETRTSAEAFVRARVQAGHSPLAVLVAPCLARCGKIVGAIS